jgi:hypothetical protein
MTMTDVNGMDRRRALMIRRPTTPSRSMVPTVDSYKMTREPSCGNKLIGDFLDGTDKLASNTRPLLYDYYKLHNIY